MSNIRQQVADLLEIKPDINFKLRDSGTENNLYHRTMSQIGG